MDMIVLINFCGIIGIVLHLLQKGDHKLGKIVNKCMPKVATIFEFVFVFFSFLYFFTVVFTNGDSKNLACVAFTLISSLELLSNFFGKKLLKFLKNHKSNKLLHRLYELFYNSKQDQSNTQDDNVEGNLLLWMVIVFLVWCKLCLIYNHISDDKILGSICTFVAGLMLVITYCSRLKKEPIADNNKEPIVNNNEVDENIKSTREIIEECDKVIHELNEDIKMFTKKDNELGPGVHTQQKSVDKDEETAVSDEASNQESQKQEITASDENNQRQGESETPETDDRDSKNDDFKNDDLKK